MALYKYFPFLFIPSISLHLHVAQYNTWYNDYHHYDRYIDVWVYGLTGSNHNISLEFQILCCGGNKADRWTDRQTPDCYNMLSNTNAASVIRGTTFFYIWVTRPSCQPCDSIKAPKDTRNTDTDRSSGIILSLCIIGLLKL